VVAEGNIGDLGPCERDHDRQEAIEALMRLRAQRGRRDRLRARPRRGGRELALCRQLIAGWCFWHCDKDKDSP